MKETYFSNEKSNYFKFNQWTLPFYEPTEKEFHWRKLTKNPPQFVLITEHDDLQLPDTDLDVFRIDIPEVFTPEIYAWPVRGVPCAIASANYELRLKTICLEYRCPMVEVYQLEKGELFGPTCYPEIGEMLEVAA